jgi:lysozyme family protein
MTASNWPAALAFTLGEEGGYTNDPQDPGAATNFGITLATLSRWRGTDCTPEDVQALTRDEAESIYWADYWLEVHGNDLPAGLDLMTWDEAVNAGTRTAARFLQRAVNATPDGDIGPHTLAACAAADPKDAILKMQAMQDAYYRSLPGFPRFGDDWIGRLGRRAALALQLAGIGTTTGATG